MGFRALLDKYPGSFKLAAAGVLIVALVFCYMEIRSGGRPPLPHLPGSQMYFTTDEGATLFVDSATRIPPFDHGGQPAVRAYVFSTEQGDRRWVQYLEKRSDEAANANLQSDDDYLVKKPGEGQWVPRTDRAAAQKIMNPPHGSWGPVIPPP